MKRKVRLHVRNHKWQFWLPKFIWLHFDDTEVVDEPDTYKGRDHSSTDDMWPEKGPQAIEQEDDAAWAPDQESNVVATEPPIINKMRQQQKHDKAKLSHLQAEQSDD